MSENNLVRKAKYYFDRIVINTNFVPNKLKELLPISELEKHCSSLWIGDTSNSGKSKGYKSKIDAKDATDQFIATLIQHDLDDPGISSIEITKDIECKTFKEAEELQHYFERNTYRKWERYRFTIEGEENDTHYLGKKHQKKSTNNLPFYPITAKKNPFTDNPALHIEFRLSNWSKIRETLKVASIYQLGSAEDIFKNLEKRFLVYNKTINRKLLIKHLIRKVGMDSDVAKKRVDHFKTIQDFREWLGFHKDQINRKKHLQPLRRKMKGSAPILTKHDKFILEMRMSYYLINKK